MKIKMALTLAAIAGALLGVAPASAAPVGTAAQSFKADAVGTPLVEQVSRRRHLRHYRAYNNYAYRSYRRSYRPYYSPYYSSYSSYYSPYRSYYSSYYSPYRSYYSPYYSSYSPYYYGYSRRPRFSISIGF